MSVHTWGEDPSGTWTIKITDTSGRMQNEGRILSWKLILHGTSEKPEHMARPRVYVPYNAVQNDRRGADAPPQTDSDSASHPEKEPKTPSNAPFSPSLALLRLLQTAFNRQTPSSSSSSSSSSWKQQQQQQAGRSFPPPATRLPPQTLYQALDVINRFRGPEDNVYSDYSDGFYREKPYRHRDDRLLQALFEMIDGDHK
ncbi:Neuroendocrine convertase 1 [Liparis tanakae]|uniref:Neuroendocrine convertase 1 n=1 Tax=Liparis tanakae TaxID=230148 RepID=A0A4Z2FDV2_9TELE|nr:Neuroendocrine convertase 1 [Liparis tanakae]